MINAAHIKIPAHGTGAVGGNGNDEIGLIKGSSTVNGTLQLMHRGYALLEAELTSRPVADCQVFSALIGELTADYLLADRDYESAIHSLLKPKCNDMKSVIPLCRNRKKLRELDTALYKNRQIV